MGLGWIHAGSADLHAAWLIRTGWGAPVTFLEVWETSGEVWGTSGELLGKPGGGTSAEPLECSYREVPNGVGADGVGVKFPIFPVNCSRLPLFQENTKKSEEKRKKNEEKRKKNEKAKKNEKKKKTKKMGKFLRPHLHQPHEEPPNLKLHSQRSSWQWLKSWEACLRPSDTER